MLERKQYNIEMEKVRKEQMKEITKYLEQFINLNASIRELPVFNPGCTELDKAIIESEIPSKGRDFREVGDEVVKILQNSSMIQHPKFMSLVSSAISPYSLAGAILTDIYNPNSCAISLCPSCCMVEKRLVKWMGSLIGYDPDKCGGVFTSGGSMSNLTALIAAREDKLPGRYDLPNGVAFIGDQCHTSLYKGLKLMGLRNDQIRKIETDDEFKIRLDLLEDAIKEEIAAGRKPFIIVGNCGSTNTGSIDKIPELADMAEKYNMWLHIDGAYGGSILFSDIYRNLAKGLERADSFTWDTHKWALQVYSCSAVFTKDKQTLLTAYTEHPEYLEDVRNTEYNDDWDLSIELSRPARYMKLWYTVQAMGTDLLSDVIDYAFYNTHVAKDMLEKLPDWEIMTKPCCGALNFRYVPKEVDADKYDELNAEISKKLLEDGYAYVITTVLKGKKCLRFCLINGNTETEDVINTVEKINEIALELKSKYERK